VTGTPNGNVGFDTEYKAFTFDGSGDYISGTQGLGTGSPVHSMSLWFKRSGVVGTYDYIVAVGNSTTFQNSAIVITANRIWFSIYGDELISTLSISNDIWYHLVVTSNGGVWNSSNCKMYIDGVSESTSTGDGETLSMTGTTVRLGTNTNGGEGFNGSIANFRLFNRALTTDEVWQLYAYQKEYFDVSPDVVTFKGGRLGIGTSEPRAVLDVRGDTFSQKYNGGRSTFLTWDYLGSRSTSFAQPTSTSGGTVASILDHEFNIPSCYHDLGTTTLKAYVNVDWRGELSNVVWNFLFRLKIYYNDYSSTYTLDSSIAPDNDSRGKGCGVPTVSYHNNNDSTLEAASVTSQFTLPNCQVSKGSKIKVELLGVLTDPGAGTVTLWTGRCANSATSISYEMAISSFFVALDVV
jgi:hypothetical protein